MVGSVYEFDCYKKFVKSVFAQRENKGRGQRIKLARFLGCQDSYVSLVLSGDRDFSIEQGEATARFLRLDDEEKEMFLLLLLRDRSGTTDSRKYFSEKVEDRRRRHLDFRTRIKIEADLSVDDKMTYYSSPLPAKVHMLLTIPGMWTGEKLAERFRVSEEKIGGVCRFLAAKGMIQEKGGKFSGGSEFLFLDKRSPFITQHHTNWRLDAINSIHERSDESLHLSLAITLSEKDAEELRKRIVKFVQECSSFIKGSREETLRAFCIDFYRP